MIRESSILIALRSARWVLFSTVALCAAVVVSALGAPHAPADRWPAWRGADGQAWEGTPVDSRHRKASYASPAVAGGRLYIRGEKHPFAIGEAPSS